MPRVAAREAVFLPGIGVASTPPRVRVYEAGEGVRAEEEDAPLGPEVKGGTDPKEESKEPRWTSGYVSSWVLMASGSTMEIAHG